MKHIVVGAAGFAGRHLVRQLVRRGEKVLLVDIKPSRPMAELDRGAYIKADVCNEMELQGIPIGQDDIVHHLAARQYHERVPRANRDAWFAEVNVDGTCKLLRHMQRWGCTRMVYFSTDMVYGKPLVSPVPVTHAQEPFGPYGLSKKQSEQVCREFRDKGMSITILRPRLIVGPGRLGILEKLFFLIYWNVPVPLIGSGDNRYQMVSVHDCVSADLCALDKGLPNTEFNLGSDNPPPVRDLLRQLIQRVGSRSILCSLPAKPLKSVLRFLDEIGLPLMYREQFGIADANYIVDISKTKQELEWNPQYNDAEMLTQAYDVFLKKHSLKPRLA